MTAQHILIATGGKPVLPSGPGIAEHCITSDDFFDLDALPHKAVVVGAGYIAVELAGILQALGTETKLVVRHEKALRQFDDILSDTLDEEMQRQGIAIYRHSGGLEKVEISSDNERETKVGGGLVLSKTVYLKDGRTIDNVDTVLMAPGRQPNTTGLNLQGMGIATTPSGHIRVNEFSETTVPHVYAIGDVTGPVELTPTAIAAGRRLADRLFAGIPNAKISHELVPTVIFCTCLLSYWLDPLDY